MCFLHYLLTSCFVRLFVSSEYVTAVGSPDPLPVSVGVHVEVLCFFFGGSGVGVYGGRLSVYRSGVPRGLVVLWFCWVGPWGLVMLLVRVPGAVRGGLSLVCGPLRGDGAEASRGSRSCLATCCSYSRSHRPSAGSASGIGGSDHAPRHGGVACCSARRVGDLLRLVLRLGDLSLLDLDNVWVVSSSVLRLGLCRAVDGVRVRWRESCSSLRMILQCR